MFWALSTKETKYLGGSHNERPGKMNASEFYLFLFIIYR
jgi:hypothetical protein